MPLRAEAFRCFEILVSTRFFSFCEINPFGTQASQVYLVIWKMYVLRQVERTLASIQELYRHIVYANIPRNDVGRRKVEWEAIANGRIAMLRH